MALLTRAQDSGRSVSGRRSNATLARWRIRGFVERATNPVNGRSDGRPEGGAVPPAPPSRFRFVFFDVGETLVRVAGPGEVYRAILARHGYDVEAASLDATIREQLKALDRVLPRQRHP